MKSKIKHFHWFDSYSKLISETNTIFAYQNNYFENEKVFLSIMNENNFLEITVENENNYLKYNGLSLVFYPLYAR